MENQEILIHKDQKEIYEFLKVENKECLNCEENKNEICEAFGCDWYNVPIIDIDEIKCIYKTLPKKDDEDVEYKEKSLLDY